MSTKDIHENREPAPPLGLGSIEGLAGRIRSARKAARLTQADLATACGLERTSVTNIEAGKQQVHAALLIRMAEVLKVMPSDLMDGPRVCCQRFDTCGQPCTPRADHWREQATALQAEVNDLNRFIARRVLRGEPATREGCNYLAEAGAVCKKCWQVHAG